MKIRKVAVIIFYDDKKRILLQNRKGIKNSAVEWGFFGGGIEDGETPEQAIVREVKEELDFNLNNFRFVGIYGDETVKLNTFISPFRDNLSKLRQKEGKSMQMFSLEEAENISISDRDKTVIRNLKRILYTKEEKIKISSSKGNLATVINYPENKTGKLAILCAGYLDSKDYGHLASLAEMLSKEGYTVVRFDSTGIWESDGSISDYTTTQYLEDIKSVLEYMLHQANYNYILIGGHSRGGQIAILYAARDPRISFVLAIMPSSKLTTKMGQRYKDWQKTGVSISYRDLPYSREQKIEFHVPYSHMIDKDKYDVIEDVKKIKVPIIFVAGELDDQCPPEIVREIFNSANEPKKFILISGIGHDYRFNADEIKLVNKNILKLIRMLENS